MLPNFECRGQNRRGHFAMSSLRKVRTISDDIELRIRDENTMVLQDGMNVRAKSGGIKGDKKSFVGP